MLFEMTSKFISSQPFCKQLKLFYSLNVSKCYFNASFNTKWSNNSTKIVLFGILEGVQPALILNNFENETIHNRNDGEFPKSKNLFF